MTVFNGLVAVTVITAFVHFRCAGILSLARYTNSTLRVNQRVNHDSESDFVRLIRTYICLSVLYSAGLRGVQTVRWHGAPKFVGGGGSRKINMIKTS